jgi:iron complex outermembrane receptor protein
MTKRNRLVQAIRLAILTGMTTAGVGAAPAVLAQTADTGNLADSEALDDSLEEVIVTGSRIAKRDNVSESPIFTVDVSAIEESGMVTLDQFLNTLPQVVPNISSQSNNPSSGGRAFIDLRGLGPTRNLVLMDGRRPMGQASGGTVVDANTIPASLIERVEIITGGAAATYGADAIAGVVNFIMKKDFDGVEFDTQYRVTEESDGEEFNFDLTFGSNFADGKGNAVFSATYFDRKAIYKGARDFAAQAQGATGIFPNGSWSPGTNRPAQDAVDALFGPNNCANSGGTRGFGFNPDGSLFCTGLTNNSTFNIYNYNGPPEHVALRFAPDTFSYNFEPDNILVLPLTRWNLYSHIEMEVNDHFQPYAQAMFTNYNALQELAATPAGGFSVPVTNPFIPDALAALLATRANPDADLTMAKRFSALGGRTGYNDHDVWQFTTGARGQITGNWDYDVYGSYGRSIRNEIQGGNVRRPETEELLDAPDGGASLCEGGLNFFGASPISQACQDYISLEAKNLTVVEQGIVEAVATGDLFELPAGEVQAAIGTSYRNIDFDFRPDSGLQPGIVAGFNEQLPVSGRLQYIDYFGEAVVPILRDLPAIQSLSATLGYRITDNNVFGSDDSWKVTLDWTISDSFRGRGGLQHAIRSPNINELFAPQLNNFPNFANQDPCNFDSSYRTGANAAQVQALCAGQAAIAGGPSFSQPFGQAQAIVGGNPNLKPEESDSWTAGFVFTPESGSNYAQRMSFSVDYWSIELDDVISAVGATTIITRCYNAEGANPSYSPSNEWCELFNRDPADGRVIDLEQFQRNQSLWELDGIDFTANLGMDIGPGELDFALIASYWTSFKQQTTSIDPTNDYAGTIGSTTGSATPEWRGTLQTTYGWDAFQVNLITRYTDSMSHANLVTSPAATATGVSSIWYVDLTGRWDMMDNLSLRLGVNNLFDEAPELYSPAVQANTDPSTYDVLGRRYFIGLEYRM